MTNKNCKYEKILIGNTMKKIRKSLGYTQEFVANELDLAPRYLSDIERNKTKGSLDTLVKLCNLYKVSPGYILKDYIDIDAIEQRQDDSLIGFYNLNNNEKAIVLKLIEFMNTQKLKDE